MCRTTSRGEGLSRIRSSVAMAVVPSRVPFLRNERVGLRQTLIASPHRLRPVVLQSVLPGSGVAVLRDRVPDLFALRRVRAGLSERVICHQQKNTQRNCSEKDDPQHGMLRSSLVACRCERRASLLVAAPLPRIVSPPIAALPRRVELPTSWGRSAGCRGSQYRCLTRRVE